MKDNHPISVDDHSDIELAELVANLRYDVLADFLKELSAKVLRDGLKDETRGRVQLASCLKNAASHIHNARIAVDKAWKISKPYM